MVHGLASGDFRWVSTPLPSKGDAWRSILRTRKRRGTGQFKGNRDIKRREKNGVSI